MAAATNDLWRRMKADKPDLPNTHLVVNTIKTSDPANQTILKTITENLDSYIS